MYISFDFQTGEGGTKPRRFKWKLVNGLWRKRRSFFRRTPVPHGIYRSVYLGGGDYALEPHDVTSDRLLRLAGAEHNWLVEEFDNFWKVKDLYKQLNFVHKRGALLHGPTGGGKTSLLLTFASRLPSITLLAGSASAAEFLCRSIRVNQPTPIFVVFEDVDAMLENNGDAESDLLSFLDGAHQTDGVYAIATTNYIEKLKDRLKNRPARFDVALEVKMPSYGVRLSYLEQVLLTTEKDHDKLVEMAHRTDGLSIAHLRELVILVYIFKKDLDEALARLDQNKTQLGFL